MNIRVIKPNRKLTPVGKLEKTSERYMSIPESDQIYMHIPELHFYVIIPLAPMQNLLKLHYLIDKSLLSIIFTAKHNADVSVFYDLPK